MRIMIKGGVWKNTEDEILKAAVMKYGLNQWARISSLLVRKSAKQCKARWYEWLDPSIKKTEWTREEDEKLLHLAKLMPTQWRTIAPIVGRTPAQCLERYEKLLDMAVSKDERYDPADDPRRLRPGEIDPNPESKPARPDPVDMDEDEKEMLSEARARLANTRGKKAKRKAREKQLEEARRLASLQKKRELKAAGIELRGKGRRYGIDYNSEVPFEKKPAPGFFDTSEETAVSKAISAEFRPVTVEELEGKRRKDIEEGLVKRDIKRQKLANEQDTPAAVAKAAELNDPQMVARRGRLMLPAPQVSEMELEHIARMSQDSGLLPESMLGAGGEATRQLLGNYAQTPAMVGPMRTPRTPSVGGDRILEGARQLAQLSSLQTPLAGGENPDISQSDFSGITPRRTVAQTPNPLATPGASPGPRAGSTTARLAIAGVPSTPSVAGTPLRAGSVTPGRGGATPMRTPIRDELGLNDMDAMAAADSRAGGKARQLMMRNELRDSLRGLPEPQFQYEVTVPELEAEGEAVPMEEDAADVRARKLKAEQERKAIEERKKSKVLQRGLPRPVSLDLLPEVKPPAEVEAMSLREKAEQYLNAELGRLLYSDNLKHPIKKKDKADKQAKAQAAELPDLEEFELEELEEAALLLEEEVVFVRNAMGHRDTALEEFVEQYNNVRRDIIWLPGQSRYGRAASATNSERLESVKGEFEGVREEMVREAKRAAKLENKVKVLTAGLERRDAELRERIAELSEAVQQAQIQLECFKALQQQERRAAPIRVEQMRQLVAAQRKRETELQERYGKLTRERADLTDALRGAVVAN